MSNLSTKSSLTKGSSNLPFKWHNFILTGNLYCDHCQEIDIEIGRELCKTYLQCERVFCRRKKEKKEEDEDEDKVEVKDADQYEFYIKWRNLPYVEATWESESRVKELFSDELAAFKKRKRCKNDPADYKQAIKSVKKKFTLLKEQPAYIGTAELRMRDYQLDDDDFLTYNAKLRLVICRWLVGF